jgi:hypothetical protein
MPFPFPDNDDLIGQYDDPEPDEIERCRHGTPVGEDCDACSEAAEEHFQERYYGSDQPVTLDEQYQQAAEQKRS